MHTLTLKHDIYISTLKHFTPNHPQHDYMQTPTHSHPPTHTIHARLHIHTHPPPPSITTHRAAEKVAAAAAGSPVRPMLCSPPPPINFSISGEGSTEQVHLIFKVGFYRWWEDVEKNGVPHTRHLILKRPCIGTFQVNTWDREQFVRRKLKGSSFDTIDHQVLSSLETVFGVRSTTFHWFQSYFLDRNQCVVVNNSASSSSPLMFSVPHGSVLGPVLFVMYTTLL